MSRASLLLSPVLVACVVDTAVSEPDETGTTTTTSDHAWPDSSASQTSAPAPTPTTGVEPDPTSTGAPEPESGPDLPTPDEPVCGPFEDPTLEAELLALFGLSQGPIPVEQALSLTALFANAYIHSLAGLECFANLEALNFYAPTGIVDLTPISGLHELEILHLAEAQVHDLAPLAGLTKLGTLDIAYNPVQSLAPLAGLPLTNLRLDGIPASGFAGLESLVQLERLSAHSCAWADISALTNMTGLVDLDLGYNQVTDLGPLANLTELVLLDLASNQIVDLQPLAGLTQLWVLDLASNAVIDIGPLAGMTQMKELSLHFNQIADVTPLTGMTELHSVILHSNAIVDLGPFVGMPWLADENRLNLSYNAIADLHPLALMPSITYIELRHNAITDLTPLADAVQLTQIDLGDNPLTTGLDSLALHPNLSMIDLSESGLVTVPVVAPAKLRHLGLYGNAIVDLAPLQAYQALATLDLRLNAVTTLAPIMDDPWLGSLERLPLNENPLDAQTLDEIIPALCLDGVQVSWGAGEFC